MIVLIPSLEPDQRLVDLVTQLRSIPDAPRVLIVDDGSGPDYAKYFDQARLAGAEVIGYTENHGKGYALKTGFSWIMEHAGDQIVMCADSDGQHTPADVLAVAEATRQNHGSLVLGARDFVDGPVVPLRSRFGNLFSTMLFGWATGSRVSDTQTGLRGCPPQMLPWLVSIPGDRFEYEFSVLLEAHQAGWSIHEIPITTVYVDNNSSSHFRPLRDSARIYAPFAKFCAASLGSFCVDFVMLLVLHAITGQLFISVVGARLISATLNYILNSRMVFHQHGSRTHESRSLPRYIGASCGHSGG